MTTPAPRTEGVMHALPDNLAQPFAQAFRTFLCRAAVPVRVRHFREA